MAALRLRYTVEKDGEIVLACLPLKRGQQVRIIVEAEPVEQPRRKMTANDLLHSALVGMWADREDIGGGLESARRLRENTRKSTTRARDTFGRGGTDGT